MSMHEALDIVIQLATNNIVDAIDHPQEASRQVDAIDIVHFARPFLAHALKMAWQGAEPKPPRDRRRALDLGGRNEHAGA